jgi:hypothetical protein
MHIYAFIGFDYVEIAGGCTRCICLNAPVPLSRRERVRGEVPRPSSMHATQLNTKEV